MHKKVTFTAILAGLLVAGNVLAAQDAAATSPIAVVSTTPETGRDGAVLGLSLRNQSPKTIVAYVLLIEYLGVDGTPVGKAAKASIRGLDPRAPSHYQVGETWRDRTGPIPKDGSGKSGIPRVSMDFVLFEDNTSWGQDTTHHSLHVRGIMHGWLASKDHLRQVLKTKGTQGLIDEVNQESTHSH
jgi:hypothetical protein